MDLSPIFNWPGITLCASVISAAWYFFRREAEHKKTVRFDIALSKIFTQLERFIAAANKVRVNINTMPLSYLLENRSNELDEWITHAVYELENMALLTEMFFESKDRIHFKEIVNAAIDFKRELHKAFAITEDASKLSVYDVARVNFNKRYSIGMDGMVEMINKRLLGGWEYDITAVRLSPSGRWKRAKHKRNQ